MQKYVNLVDLGESFPTVICPNFHFSVPPHVPFLNRLFEQIAIPTSIYLQNRRLYNRERASQSLEENSTHHPFASLIAGTRTPGAWASPTPASTAGRCCPAMEPRDGRRRTAQPSVRRPDSLHNRFSHRLIAEWVNMTDREFFTFFFLFSPYFLLRFSSFAFIFYG